MTKRLKDPPCITPFLVLVIAGLCITACFARGWYYVDYAATASKGVCQLPLWECTMVACKPQQKVTGFQGRGDCGVWDTGRFFFALAALYAILYVMYLSGALHGQCSTWVECNPSKCCVNTEVNFGSHRFCGCCKSILKGSWLAEPEPGVLPHGALFIGTPALMCVGLFFVMVQPQNEFDGIVNKGYGWLFYFMVIITLLAFGLCYIMMCFANVDGHKEAEMKSQALADPYATPNTMERTEEYKKMPESCVAGFYYNTNPSDPDSNVEITDESQLQGVYMTTEPMTMVFRPEVDTAEWVAVDQLPDFVHLIDPLGSHLATWDAAPAGADPYAADPYANQAYDPNAQPAYDPNAQPAAY